MTGQQEISNTLLYPVFMPTITAHHLSLANFGFKEKSVQVPHYFLMSIVPFGGGVDNIRS